MVIQPPKQVLSSEIVEYINSFKIDKGVMLNILKIFDVVEVKNSDHYGMKYLFRMAQANIPNSDKSFAVKLRNFSISSGVSTLSISPRTLEYFKALPEYEIWNGKISNEAQYLGEQVIPFSVSEFVKGFKEKEFSIKELVDFVVDDTGSKSEELVKIAKTMFIPLPIGMKKRFQRYNNHSLILTRGGTGKNVTFQNATGTEAITDYTEPGLKGSVGKDKEFIPGAFQGEGFLIFDEIDSNKKFKIMDEAGLTYMEDGESARMIHPPIRVNGSKTVIFLGNSDCDDLGAVDFKKAFVTLTDENRFDRSARRIKHVLYGGYDVCKNVTLSESDELMKGVVKSIISSLVEVVKPQIKSVISECLQRWYKDETDEAYEVEITTLMKVIDDYGEGGATSIHSFLSGMRNELCYRGLRYAALKYVLIENIIELFPEGEEKFSPNVFIDKHAEELDEIYQYFKQVNLDSMKNIVNPTSRKAYVEFRTWYVKENTRMLTEIEKYELMEKFKVSYTTIWRYITRVKKEVQGGSSFSNKWRN